MANDSFLTSERSSAGFRFCAKAPLQNKRGVMIPDRPVRITPCLAAGFFSEKEVEIMKQGK
jgi:hypothetical protein